MLQSIGDKIFFSKKYFLFLGFFIIGLTGVITHDRFNYLPATTILEIMFFFSSFLYLSRVQVQVLPFIALSIFYVWYSYISAIYFNATHILDFMQAYKAFIYVPFLALSVGKQNIDSVFISRLLRVLLLFFLIKYGYSQLFDIRDRPGVFTENNFELIFLLLVFYLNFLYQEKLIWIEFLVLCSVFILSGSRSAMLALIFVFFMMSIKKIDWKLIINMFFLSLLILATVYISIQRMNTFDLEQIDRFRFLMMFIHDTADWEWWRFFTGASPLTPMSDFVCQKLLYYSRLFSYSSDGSCYSVILHSYILRVIFDHGLIGFGFLFYFIFQGLRYSGFRLQERFTVMGVIFITSLSVSAMNNIYVILALLLYFASNISTKHLSKGRS
ncbi:MAG: hypothetical protein U9Q40_08715 [Campylobacterota bacterium]|nr:hypothetical protein [Campylobacterota bacterium]